MLIDRRLRHPLCPYCRYDLVATVKVGGRVCPECGEDFELHELIREPRPGEWTDTVGLRRLTVSLLVRGVIGLGIWALWLWGVSGLTINNGIKILAVYAGHVIIGVIVGKVQWKGLRERSGFDGLIPACAAILAAWFTIAVGAALIGLLTPLSTAHAGTAAFTAAIAALVVILPAAFLDE